jgi:hypothetical protein
LAGSLSLRALQDDAMGLGEAGALYHTFVLRDGLLRRMSFGRRWISARLMIPAE